MQRDNISEKILHIRKMRNMSREGLAEAADLSVSYIYQIESGKKNIGLSALLKIADVLSVSLDELVRNNQELPEKQEGLILLEELIADCSYSETIIIIENARNLKQTLRQYR